MYICCCENICSQNDDFESAFEFLNENLRVADIFCFLLFFNHPDFCFFSKQPTDRKCCVFLFLLGLLSFRGGRMHSELIYYMCSEICGIRGVGVGFLIHKIRLNARRRR